MEERRAHDFRSSSPQSQGRKSEGGIVKYLRRKNTTSAFSSKPHWLIMSLRGNMFFHSGKMTFVSGESIGRCCIPRTPPRPPAAI